MKKIESICNKILKGSKDKNINFIDWLHYVKNHEYLLKKYQPEQFRFFKIISNIVIYILINFRNLFLNSAKFIINNKQCNNLNEIDDPHLINGFKESDYVIFSTLSNNLKVQNLLNTFLALRILLGLHKITCNL